MKKLYLIVGIMLLGVGFSHAGWLGESTGAVKSFINAIDKVKTMIKDNSAGANCKLFIGNEYAYIYDTLTPEEQEKLCSSCSKWWGKKTWGKSGSRAGQTNDYVPILRKCCSKDNNAGGEGLEWRGQRDDENQNICAVIGK